MRRGVLTAFALGVLLCGRAAAETGVGPAPPHGAGALEPNAPALSTFGGDAIRVRAYPAFAGTWLVELHGKPDESAEGEAVFFGPYQRATRSRARLGSVRLTVWPGDWPKLTAQVDALLADGQAPPPPLKPGSDQLGEVCVTADGTSYEIERRRAGRDFWMTSLSGLDYCGGRDPSEAVAQLVFTAAALHLCEAMQGAAPCKHDRPPPPDAVAEYR